MENQYGVCEEAALSMGCSWDHSDFPGSLLPSDLCLGTPPLLGVDGDDVALFPESDESLQLCPWSLLAASIAPRKSAVASMQVFTLLGPPNGTSWWPFRGWCWTQRLNHLPAFTAACFLVTQLLLTWAGNFLLSLLKMLYFSCSTS